MGMLAPIGTTALPVAMRLSGKAMQTIFIGGGGIGATSSGLLGGIGRLGKGAIIGTLVGLIGGNAIEDLIISLADMFGGDEGEAAKVIAILSAIEDAHDSGAILIPEPPRGYTGTIYQERLNYFHVNTNNGNMWLSDFSNGRNSMGRR